MLFKTRTGNRQSLSVAFWKHHPVADQHSDTLVAATLAFHHATQGDIVKLTPAGNYQVADRGGCSEWQEDVLGRRTFVERAITHPEQWLQQTDTLTPLELEIIRAAKQLKKSLPNTPLLATVFLPLTQALMMTGSETLLTHLQCHPEEVTTGLKILTRCTQRLIAAYQDIGIDGIYLAAQHQSDAVIPRSIYRDFGLPYDQQIMQACRDLSLNILHIHGTMIHFEGVPQENNWMVHFELSEHNPEPEVYRTHCRCPAVIGLPCKVWQNDTELSPKINSLLQRFGQTSALLSADCVTPLNISSEHIASWIQRIRHVC
ncbi:MAG: hypothetical protein I8H92_12720 [Moraxellaceae bacterium]|nr:hypothetical protein [Moraxellaceae bacterium]